MGRAPCSRFVRLLLGLVQRCAPLTLGTALLASFPPPAGTGALPDERGVSCLGGWVRPGSEFEKMVEPSHVIVQRHSFALFAAKREMRTTDELQTLALALYSCVPEYVTSGPLAHAYGLTDSQATCLADWLVHYPGLIPEVSRALFRAGELRSETLSHLIETCTFLTPPAPT